MYCRFLRDCIKKEIFYKSDQIVANNNKIGVNGVDPQLSESWSTAVLWSHYYLVSISISWMRNTFILEVLMKELINVAEAAAYLGLAKSTVYKLVSWKRIPFYKVGARVLFDKGMLSSWVERYAVIPFGSDRNVNTGGGNNAA